MVTGLPRMIRQHELQMIVPLADSTIFEMDKRGECPARLNPSSPLCRLAPGRGRGVTEQRRSVYLAIRVEIASTMDVGHRKSGSAQTHGRYYVPFCAEEQALTVMIGCHSSSSTKDEMKISTVRNENSELFRS